MSTVRKVVIVGGVAGGASAAARARRLSETADIVVFERGPYVSFANCGLPYHLGGEITERDALLLHSPESLQARLGLDVRVNTEVLAIDRARQTVSVRELPTGACYEEPYDALILAPGAAALRPNLPGLDAPWVHTLRTLPDLDRLLAALTSEVRHVSVVGGGFIGLECVEALRHRGLAVTLVERGAQVMAPLDPEMLQPLMQSLQAHGVELRLGASLLGVEAGTPPQLLLAQGEQEQRVSTDLVILALGVVPETALARAAGLTLGLNGAVVVDAQQRSSDPNIYAVGDAVEVRHVVHGQPALLPLAGPANRQGRVAADSIFGVDHRFRGVQGTAICRVFEQVVASTGLNEKTLKQLGRPYRKLFLHGGDHASYYPGASMVSLKILFDPESRQLLGAQVVGQQAVDKRIDVLAMALQAQMTVDDLAEVELAYAPPFGSAKDQVNLAGMAAQNLLAGHLQLLEVEDLSQVMAEGAVLLDVREPEELQAGVIPGAKSWPLSQMRDRDWPWAQDAQVVVYCQAGLRGYIAQRHLRQRGYAAYSLNGGWQSWLMHGGQPEPWAG